MGCGVWALGFRVQGDGFRAKGLWRGEAVSTFGLSAGQELMA